MAKQTNPYRKGSDYNKVAELAVKLTQRGELEFSKLATLISRKTRIPVKNVKHDLRVFCNADHESNGGKSRDVSQNRGFVKLEFIPA